MHRLTKMRTILVVALIATAGCGQTPQQRYKTALSISNLEKEELGRQEPAFAAEVQIAIRKLTARPEGYSERDDFPKAVEMAKASAVGIAYTQQQQRALLAERDARAAETASRQ
jgi:hypothetical protein